MGVSTPSGGLATLSPTNKLPLGVKGVIGGGGGGGGGGKILINKQVN